MICIYVGFSDFSNLIRVSDDLYIHVLHMELKNAWGKLTMFYMY